MKFKKRYILLALVALYLTDQIAVYAADKLLLARDAYLEEHLELASRDEDIGDEDGPYHYGCKFRYIFLIYGYQTCLGSATTPETGLGGYEFTYNYPRPKTAFFLRGDGPENYYFQHSRLLGKRLKHIRRDGTVQDVGSRNF